MSVQYSNDSTGNKEVLFDFDKTLSENDADLQAQAVLAATRQIHVSNVYFCTDDTFANLIPMAGASIQHSIEESVDAGATWSPGSTFTGTHMRFTFRPTQAWINDRAVDGVDGVIYVKVEVSTLSGVTKEVGGKLTWNNTRTDLSFSWV